MPIDRSTLFEKRALFITEKQKYYYFRYKVYELYVFQIGFCIEKKIT